MILSEGSTFFNTQSRSPYNGNIRNAVYGYKNVASSVSRGYSYQYDQLNRLLQMYGWDSYNASTMAWNNTSPLTAYQNMLSYSADGNISTQLRLATGSMDSLTYFYLNNADPLYPSQQSNRLNYVKDQAGSAGLGELPNQTTGNYSYTSNGNLSADASENLAFTWTPSNKLERVNKTSGGNTHTFRYSYDALGNRLSKRITYSTGSLPDNDTTWYYVRDAQGNPLATYIQYGSLLNSTPTYWMYLKEQMLYGSDRLGVQSQHKIVYKPLGGLPSLTDTIRQFLGSTAYELTNHLGNVLATVSDRHLGRAAAPGAVNHYLADILTQTDFYPFGMGMPGRTYSAGQYRYGFNGQEKDDGISGVGNHNTALFWEYDTRLGRRWNLDPRPNPAISNYSAFANNPILFSDPFGDTLDIGNNEASRNDILSLVSPSNQKFVVFNNNQVNIEFGNLDEESQSALLKTEEGLSVIYDLVSSNKKFLYEASDVALVADEKGNKSARPMFMDPTSVVNASNFGKDSEGGYNIRPRPGFDGHVIINPDAVFKEYEKNGSTVLQKPRSSMVFHELVENYERTHNNIDYSGKAGAHNLAIVRERKWHMKSNRPGEVSEFAQAQKPSEDRMKQIVEIIRAYKY